MHARFKTMGDSNQGVEITMRQPDWNPPDMPNVDPQNPRHVDEKNPASETKLSKFAETFRGGLDDVIGVNSLFGSAVFIGLSFSYITTTLETREECKPGEGIAKWLVIFEITAFGFFILSTLLGKALKVHLYITTKEPGYIQTSCRAMMIMCGISTILGSAFLFLSMINVLQMRLGKLSCTGHVWIGAVALSFLYFLALLSWVPSIVYASILAWKHEF